MRRILNQQRKAILIKSVCMISCLNKMQEWKKESHFSLIIKINIRLVNYKLDHNAIFCNVFIFFLKKNQSYTVHRRSFQKEFQDNENFCTLNLEGMMFCFNKLYNHLQEKVILFLFLFFILSVYNCSHFLNFLNKKQCRLLCKTLVW